MIVSLDRYRRKRWSFNWTNRPAAPVIPLKVKTPKLIMPVNQVEDYSAAPLDNVELATNLYHQSTMVPHLGTRIKFCYESLELLVGHAEATRQVLAIVNEYLMEDRVA